MATKTIKTRKLYRNFTFAREALNEEARTAELSFSSEEPYRRWFGTEILSHEKTAVDLERIKRGGPLLVDHDTQDQVGVVEKAFIDEKSRRGRAVVRFSRSSRGDEVYQDVLDGIRQNVSVGYVIHKMRQEDSDPDDPVFTATRWEPLEVSIVAVPADTSVGVGRQATSNDFTTEVEMQTKEIRTMENEEKKTEKQTITPVVNVDEVKKDTLSAERSRVADILTAGEKYGLQAAAAKAVRDNMSVVDFNQVILEQQAARLERVKEPPEIGLTEKETQKYSFIKVLRAAAFGAKNPRVLQDAAFELECSRAAAEKMGREPSGIMVPYDALIAKRTLTAGTATDGAELVADNLLAGSFIDVLRNATVVIGMGARMMTGLVGNVSIPRKTTGSTAGWIATEGGNAAESEAQFDQVQMSPKTLGAYTDLSRQLLMQATPDAEDLIRDDLAQAVAIAIDLAALYGSGASGQPYGIANTNGINAPTAFAAAVPTYGEVVAMESAVAVDNALLGSLGYIIEPSMRGSLKTTEKATNTAQFVWEPGNTVNGYRCGVTSQVTSGDVFFGNWNDLILAFWGGLDVTVDPYTNSLSGTVRIVVHQSIDVAVRHPVSFAFNNDGV